MAIAPSSRTVLIVEDEYLMRRLLGKVVTGRGASVLLAADGAEAIDMYTRHKDEILVVLLDLGLPKVSGWDVFTRLKEQNPKLRVVVASGYMEPAVKSKMQEAGVKHFIEKPYMLDEVVHTLQSEIDSA